MLSNFHGINPPTMATVRAISLNMEFKRLFISISLYIYSEQWIVWKSLSRVRLFVTPWTVYSPGQNTGVGSLSLLQEIFSIQGSNPPHCRWILYQLSHKGSPRILEWVAYPFSRGIFQSSQPRNWTQVSCITGRFFTNWAIREALCTYIYIILPYRHNRCK